MNTRGYAVVGLSAFPFSFGYTLMTEIVNTVPVSLPDKVLYPTVKGFDRRRFVLRFLKQLWGAGLIVPIRHAGDQAPGDHGHDFENARRQTFKHLLVGRPSQNGIEVIWNVNLRA